MRLAGKVSIVTGSARGIGRATAELFAREGAKVVVADVDEENGRETVRRIGQYGGEAFFLPTDVGRDEDVEHMIRVAVDRYGKIDVLHNNVGIAVGGNVVETSPADWHRILNVNLASTYRGCHFAIPEMLRNGGGSIVNTASVQGILGIPDWAAYAAAKGGMIALTRQIAVQYAKQNIRVNCVCPGGVLTTMAEKILAESPDPETALKAVTDTYPMGRLGRPEEIAYAALFLACDESSFVTGHALVADGGFSVS